MSLATRCNACGTVFRVVQDQLKVSEGWVRCGRCQEVFNALDGLFDLDRDSPPEWSPSQFASGSVAAPVPVPPPPASQPAVESAAPAQSPQRLDRIDAQLLGPRHSGDQSTPARRVSERDRLEFPDAQFDSNLLADDPEASSGYELTVLEPIGEEPAGADEPAPEFLLRAQRQQRWRSPWRRAALGGFALLLLAALGLQVAHQFRDLIAERWPASKPALLAWCRFKACTLEAPRRIEDLSVENTALEKVGRADAFKLSVSLRNRGNLLLALPSVDLSLTDPAGQLVVRRVLTPRDFRTATSVIQPGAETALQLLLATDDAKVSGYTVEIFYP